MKIWSIVDRMLPIRKVSPEKVALTSYYGKVFVERSRKQKDSLAHWYQKTIAIKAYGADKAPIISVSAASGFSNQYKLPRVYTAVSMNYREIQLTNGRLIFNRDALLKIVPEHAVKLEHRLGHTVIGVGDNYFVTMDELGAVYHVSAGMLDKNEVPEEKGQLYEYLGLEGMPPQEYAEIGIFGEPVAVGLYLAYHLGLSNLIKELKVTPQIVPHGERRGLPTGTHFSLAFADVTMYFEKDAGISSLILAGLGAYAKSLKNYESHTFDKHAVYLNILESHGLSTRYIREMELIDLMFVDPITRQILTKMKEPTDFRGLLKRSCELLLLDQHPDEMAVTSMRLKGSEIIAGAVYTEMVQAIRVHRGSPGTSNQKLSLNPFAVWQRLVDDPIKIQVNEIGPLAALKEEEAATFGGTQGRSIRTMPRSTRVLHPSAVGVMSEATPDSGDVGYNVHISPAAKITDAYGMIGKFDKDKDGYNSILSTAAMVSPGSTGDDC